MLSFALGALGQGRTCSTAGLAAIALGATCCARYSSRELSEVSQAVIEKTGPRRDAHCMQGRIGSGRALQASCRASAAALQSWRRLYAKHFGLLLHTCWYFTN